MKKSFKTLLLLVVSTLSQIVVAQSYVDYYRAGFSHFEKGEYKEFVEALSKADSLRPNHPIIMYNLAVGYAKLNDHKKAAETLKSRFVFNASGEFVEDEDFESLRASEYYSGLKSYFDSQTLNLKKSEIAFEINEKGFHPEGIAFDKASELFYVTDVHNGSIVSFTKEGQKKKVISDLADQGFWGAFGIKLDPTDSSLLWATSSALPEFKGYNENDEGRSVLLKIDKASGRVLETFESSDDKAHVFGDLLIAKNGDIYISDSAQPNVYKLNRKNGEFDLFITDGSLWNLQGLAISKDQSSLILSDYILGIVRVDLETRELSPLMGNENSKTRGSDGIYIAGDKLVLLQNGTAPRRITYTLLNEDGTIKNDNVVVTDQNVQGITDPTLGVVIGSDFYFIGNSPWQFYEKGKALYEKWPTINIYKLKLDEI